MFFFSPPFGGADSDFRHSSRRITQLSYQHTSLTHTNTMSSAHAPQNLPADLNESSQQQQNTHELADGCDDADTYLSASFVFFLISRKNRSLVFFFVMGVVGAHVGFNGNRSNRSWFFLCLRDHARDPRTSVSRDAKRDALVVSRLFVVRGERKAGGVRAFWWPLVFFRPLFSLRDLVTKGTSKGRVSGAFSAKKQKKFAKFKSVSPKMSARSRSVEQVLPALFQTISGIFPMGRKN